MRQNTVLDSAAQRLRELHQIGRPLLLVNVWDAAGARAVEAAGSPAIATSSVAMAGVRGGSDGNSDREAAFAQLRQITAAVDVPVTADLEGGYGLAPGDLVDAMLAAVPSAATLKTPTTPMATACSRRRRKPHTWRAFGQKRTSKAFASC
jgi:2-methylisocitrate lyase-like PEP mutase family enzyme